MERVDEMDLLLTSFVDDFPYNERYIVQNIHCIKHFATTTKDFGPLSNYSTFNYESVIGKNTCVRSTYPIIFEYLFFFIRMFIFINSWYKTTWY
jgi:hypothetical protein